MPTSVNQFLARIEKSNLLSVEQLAAVRSQVAPVRDAIKTEPLIRRLIKEGVLTDWQAQMLLAGRKAFFLGNYKLVDLLGRGGMGTVFKAEHTVLGRTVAVKVMAKKLVKNEQSVARFHQEIQAAAALDNPHVVRAFDADSAGNTHFLVMEYVEGEALSSIIGRRGKLPIGEACEYVRQAGLGLQHAHERGMIHRDLKPSNLIVTWRDENEPVVKILDMGLARFASEQVEDASLTRTGQVMGTPDYMSPEQAWDTKAVDIRGDIYSLGCTLFHLITDRVPLQGDNALQTLMVRSSSDGPGVREFEPAVPPELDAVVRKMLARDPAQRFQTPAEVADALAPFCVVPNKALAGAAQQRPADAVPTVGQNQQPETQPDAGFEQFLNDLATKATPPPAESSATPGRENSESGSQQAVAGRSEIPTKTRPSQGDKSVQVELQRRNQADRKRLWLTVSCVCAFAVLIIGYAVWPKSDHSNGDQRGASTNGRAGNKSGKSTKEETLSGVPNGKAKVPTIDDAAKPDGREDQTSAQPSKKESDAPPPSAVFLQPIPKQTVAEGSRLAIRLPVNEDAVAGRTLRFALGTDAPKGAAIERQSGLFSWTPSEEQGPGLYRFMVQGTAVSESGLEQSQSTALTIHVSEVDQPPVLAAIPNIVIDRKRELRVAVKAVDPDVPPNQLAFRLEGNMPEGITIDARTGVLTWKPAKPRALGTHRITIRVVSVDQPKQSDVKSFLVRVVKTAETPVADNLVPSETEQQKAEKQIRDVFRRDFARARTAAQRAALARKLLARALASGRTVTAFVLYRLAQDYALRARDFETAVASAQFSSRRFQTDTVAMTLDCLKTFRLKGTTLADRQSASEAALSAAKGAVEQARFGESLKLVTVADNIARGEKDRELLVHMQTARALLKTVREESKPAGSGGELELTEKAKLAKAELLEILTRLEFIPLFAKPQGFSFLKHSAADLPDRGRSLWSFQDGNIRLETPAQKASTGFLDKGKGFDKFTLRAKVATDNTTGSLLMGAPQSGRFDGLKLQLGPTDFCQVKKDGSNQPLAGPLKQVARGRTGWDLIELRVKQPRIVVKVNGLKVVDANVPGKTAGFLGLDAFLGSGKPQTRFKLQKVRIRPN